MKVLEQLQVLKSSIDKLKKLNEDLLELNSAKKIKITSLENRIIKLNTNPLLWPWILKSNKTEEPFGCG